MRVDVYIVLCRARVIPKLEMCICVRTIARIWQHVDNENEEQVPKIPRQTSLCMLVNCSDFLCALCSCVYLLETVRVRACMVVYPRASARCSAFMSFRDLSIASLAW